MPKDVVLDSNRIEDAESAPENLGVQGYEQPHSKVAVSQVSTPPSAGMFTGALSGRIALGVVVVSCEQRGYEISDDEFRHVKREVERATTFLANAKPTANVSFEYDWRLVSVAPDPNGDPKVKESKWLLPALKKMNLEPNMSATYEYLAELQRSKKTDDAYVLFLTKYPTWHKGGYIGGQRTVIMSYLTDTSGQNSLHAIFAHETCHIFSAVDEYGAGGNGSCGSIAGKVGAPNYNSVDCSWARVPCLMDKNALELCQYTQWQIGWNNGTLANQSIGPSGGTGGKYFEDRPLSARARITKILVRHGRRIDAVGIGYERHDGVGPITAHLMHGGGGGTLAEFALERDEFVTGIKGYASDRVDSLQITTTKNRTSPVYGTRLTDSKPFGYTIADPTRTFVGFCGRSGSAVDALGMILTKRDEFVREPSLTMGMSGGPGGLPQTTELPPNARLTKIRIRHGECIDAIGLSYVDDYGKHVDLPMLGGTGGKLEEYVLDEGDYLVGISGRYDRFVHSLIIQTYYSQTKSYRFSKRFGGSGGKADFSYVMQPGTEDLMIRGLDVRCSKLIYSVGVKFKRKFF